MPPTPAERLAAGLKRMPNGCLEWTRSVTPKGYGKISVDGVRLGTHRLAWELAHGPIPPGMFVLHHCDNPPCCDAYKCLFLGTVVENVADKMAKGRHSNGRSTRTHCPEGHRFTEATTYVNPNNGQRKCRVCSTDQRRQRRRANRVDAIRSA